MEKSLFNDLNISCKTSLVRLGLFLVYLSLASRTTFVHGQDHDLSGSWELLVENAGISSMHAALTHFGTVIILDRTNIGESQIKLPNGRCRDNPDELKIKHDCTAHSIEFSPATNYVRPLFIYTDTWCSSGSFTADGTLVQTGGDFDGLHKVRRFSPCDNGKCDWEESDVDYLQDGRWYATNVLLADNSQIIVGGRGVQTIEFLPSKPKVYLDLLAKSSDYEQDNLYPFVHLLPDGNLFIFANRDSILYDHINNIVVRTYPTIPGEPRNYPSAGSSVLLPLVASDGYKEAQILICGGAQQGAFAQQSFAPASQSCGRITASARGSDWIMEDMPSRRVMGDMLILPNRDVLIINGAGNGAQGWGLASNPCLNPVLYKPSDKAGNRFVTLAPTTIPRLYHSTANLLPDGRILIAGSNTHEFYTFDGEFPTELRIEAFSPAYLDKGYDMIRPTIQKYADLLIYNQEFEVILKLSTPPLNHLELNLVSCPFTTHSFSMNLRVLRLGTTQPQDLGAGLYRLIVTAPPSAEVAPASYYMLFAVYKKVPSHSVWVHLSR